MYPARGLNDTIRLFDGSLTTARLRLRAMNVTDAPALFTLFDDFEVVRWLAQPDWPQAFVPFAESVERIVAEKQRGEALHFVILLEEQPIGGLSLINLDGHPVIGYWLGRRYWNAGYMTEAARAVCDWIFKATDAAAIYSGIFVGNESSLRIQIKLGFQICGRSRAMCCPLGKVLDHIDTRLDRNVG